MFEESLTPWLTGAGSRRLEGTDIGHENAEGMAYVGVRVEPPVRLGSVVEGRAAETAILLIAGCQLGSWQVTNRVEVIGLNELWRNVVCINNQDAIG